MLWAVDEPNSNPGLLRRSQVRYLPLSHHLNMCVGGGVRELLPGVRAGDGGLERNVR
jgi:hypothetical protein